MNADVLSSTSKLKIAGGSGGSGGSGGLGGWGIGCGLNTRHGGKGGNGKNGESGLAGTIRVSTGRGDGVIKSDVGSHDIDVLYFPDILLDPEIIKSCASQCSAQSDCRAFEIQINGLCVLRNTTEATDCFTKVYVLFDCKALEGQVYHSYDSLQFLQQNKTIEAVLKRE